MKNEAMKRPKAVTLLSLRSYVIAVFWLLIAGVVLLFSKGAPSLSIGRAYLELAALFLGLSVLRALCGYGLWRLKPYGRLMEKILSLLGLILFSLCAFAFADEGGIVIFPVGVLLAVLVLLYQRKSISRPDSGVVLTSVCFVLTLLFYSVLVLALMNMQRPTGGSIQKRTLADMRSIGTAIEAYGVDHTGFPVAKSIQELRPMIEPEYIKKLPLVDGWENEFRVVSGEKSYTICSCGKDGAGCGTIDYRGPTHDFNNDIVFSNFEFVVYPEGMSQ